MLGHYVARGWELVRIPPMSKGPVETDWQHRRYTPEDFTPADNVGVKLTNGLVDVDLDCPEAVALAPHFLPPTATFGRASKPASHWLYQVDGFEPLSLPRKLQVELRTSSATKGTIKQTVFPPSVHPSGEVVEWSPNCPELARLNPGHLVHSFALLAVSTLVAQLWPVMHEAHAAHDFALALAGALYSEGWPLEETEAVILAGAALHSPDPGHRVTAVRDTYDDSGRLRTGWPTLAELVPTMYKTLERTVSIRPKQQVIAGGKQPDRPVYPHNDMGNAAQLVDLYGEDLRFCEGIGWLRWDGCRWLVSDGPWGEMQWLTNQMHQDGIAMGGPIGKTLAQWGLKSGDTARIRSAIEQASHDPRVRVPIDALDGDPYLLNTPSGTVELRTGTLREHRREDLITKMTPVQYDARAECPRFVQFLRECMDGDEGLVLYLLRFLGYALTGSTDEHVLAVWHGPSGANGKSTLLSVLLYLLGDYAGTVAPDVLLAQQGSTHPTGLMDFRGKRLVVSDETPEGKRWNEALVKRLTGGGTLKARGMRQDFVEFQMSHKLVLATNARPVVREQGGAFWRRVQMVPWLVSFRNRADRNLLTKLIIEGPGILRLLVEGCRAWYENDKDLAPPDAVSNANAEYRESQDLLGEFLAECCEVDPTEFLKRTELYQRYKSWATEGNEHVLPASAFYRVMGERPEVRSIKRGGVRGFAGLKIAASGLRALVG